ncbi:ZNF81 protein, partial [Tricholaema leucomelas]|nr:ZNF81 protein [Tricholaema leucomelas]
CRDCRKSFTSRTALSFHRNIHTGERPYICSECGRGFASNSALNLHCQNHAA